MLEKTNNIAEEYVKIVNDNLFLREFTFSRNELKPNEKDEIELADNIVWLDEILFLIQIKWRNDSSAGTEENEVKWFNNKVLKKAKSQIKKTIKYFENFSNLEIENGRGFKVNLSEAPISNAKKIIIYLPSDRLPEKEKFLKFYNSQEIGLIHIFNFEDYRWICQYLITPCEIVRFFDFRENMFELFGEIINSIPEQLILGKFLSGDEINEINAKYIEYLHRFEDDIDEFDISPFLQNFYSKTTIQNFKTDYIPIVKEMAKLSRFELKEFKRRLLRSIEKSKSKGYTIPYRITFPRTKVGFVFIPISIGDEAHLKNWKNALINFTLAHKYDQELDRAIGVTIFRSERNEEYIEIQWGFIDFVWERDENMENLLKKDFPFREVKLKKVGDYKFKEE